MRLVVLASAVIGVVAILLGGLWFLQGTGLVVIEPVACLGECTPVTGPAPLWAISGAILFLLGCVALKFAWGRRRVASAEKASGED
ncbi:hypothetical protein [Qipengyuania sp. MTN3-11]|uniref:hypothetical protein n=1 Tax=Qipengyuania sp. MTN3-11 TaxID=3056557 RepID=UPI0036F2A41F